MAIFRPDVLIRSFEGQPIAIVEVKNRHNLSREVATEIRRNMLARGLPSHIPYFLLLSQDVGFLWKDSTVDDLDAPPTYEFPMDKVVHRYSQRSSDERLYPTELELLVLEWLTDLSTEPQEALEEPEKTLARSGLSASIKRGMVLIEEKLGIS